MRPHRVFAPALAVAAGLAVLLAALSAGASPPPLPVGQLPPALEGIGIDERPGATVPRDVALTDQDGRRVTLGDLVDGSRPVVLQLAYYRCPMLCTLVLNALTDGLRGLPWTPGERFRVVIVSIDPRDTAALAHDKRAHQLASYGRPVGAHGWEFLVGDEREVRRLADAVGFRYRWDAATQQYAHAAGVFVLTPDGRLSRTLYGASFPSKTLELALVEASGGRIGSAWERVVLFCYHWDPSSGGYTVAATRIMKLGGVLTLLVLAIVIARLARGRAPANDAIASKADGPRDAIASKDAPPTNPGTETRET